MKSTQKEWNMHAHCVQQRAWVPETAPRVAINTHHIVDGIIGMACTWRRPNNPTPSAYTWYLFRDIYNINKYYATTIRIRHMDRHWSNIGICLVEKLENRSWSLPVFLTQFMIIRKNRGSRKGPVSIPEMAYGRVRTDPWWPVKKKSRVPPKIGVARMTHTGGLLVSIDAS